METLTNAEDLIRIEKSNKAIQVHSALPLDQRTAIVAGLVAAMQLSGKDLEDIKKRVASFSWFEVFDY